jgi:hypothetical protein
MKGIVPVGYKDIVHRLDFRQANQSPESKSLTRSIHKYPLSRKKNGKAQGFPVRRPGQCGIRLKNSSDSPFSGMRKTYNKLTSLKYNYMNFSG